MVMSLETSLPLKAVVEGVEKVVEAIKEPRTCSRAS